MALGNSDIKEIQIFAILEHYAGKNPYIYGLKKKWDKSKKKLNFTITQMDYIIGYHDKDPIKLNRVMEIGEYYGEELKKSEKLSFVPVKILIEFMLAETDKAFHIFGKIKQNQVESRMYWIPKNQLIDDPYFETIDVDSDITEIIKLDTLNRTPYEHQREGVEFQLSRANSILGFQMGLGKTYVSIVSALKCEAKKVLIVCPSSLKYNWKREIECFTDDVTVIEGKLWDTARFTIINYDILKNFHSLKPKDVSKADFVFESLLVDSKFDLVIMDEAHFLKNPESQRGKIMNEVCNTYGVDRTWLLTGTPIANRPMDFFNLLKLTKSPVADNWVHYAKRYCEGKQFFKRLKNGAKKQIWITDGASNLGELFKRTKNIMLRRLTEEVLDMPDKVILPVYHDMNPTQLGTYNNLWDKYLLKRRKEGKKVDNLDKDLLELGLLRQHMAMSNVENTIRMAESAIEEGRKVVVFCNYTEELNLIANHFNKTCVRHNGSMSAKAKQDSVDKFQNSDKIKIFVGNIISAGAGITLTQGTVCIFNSLDWVPGNVMQAIYRCYRIGQDKKVFIYFNIFKDSVDERVWGTLFKKTDIISQAIGDNVDGNIFNGELSDDEKNIINGIIGNVD